MNDLEWADKLDKVAEAIAQTIYHHGIAIEKHGLADRFINHDDRDYLHEFARELRVREYRRLLAEAEAAK